ncbi:phenylalanyl-tRNA synthetase alpha chain [Dethiosulfatibacter aminovorans DSM 17477]|uniref:Phenylalanyl-tRNA synthetase alpha chain n=1 Tax=Dethiosulfatibacter aminovorans DSM 17477 TaxID=1121476 RepID=A0A1M6F412_9FIRM|nr:pyrrolysine--tRNA(Pyl) ligase large subunit [Dethiosulfatibacter aminovorans]SHI92484.1 phenylalanyl-tRNA synthetase alpha chain [Dethiosulfatibacter aminovorans DSM 17477]
MSEKFTVSQVQRLKELDAPNELFDSSFESKKERDEEFKINEKQLARKNRELILNLLEKERVPKVCRIEDQLVEWLTGNERFTRVTTPVIISSGMLDKMTIDSDHPLRSQVFWLDSKKCLRPMHAPSLYTVMRDLYKLTKQPVRIFESGPCFRKETQGANHMNEFTMLNLVELAGVEEGEQMDRLVALAKSAMNAIGLEGYELKIESSEVYGETLDIEYNGIELASGAYGPHVLDANWGIFNTWVGIGFGLERIAMVMSGYSNIKRTGRSLSYINGARLNV